ncbi:MAG: phage virion morphogenesis protein [Paracoccus sp. (in: a-proteobacteria)]|uniref:phage virion morphogenesis protein n=1 Tax=Paracoccus sp. TaxID=267 RepID=UPI0026DECD60|nr:phage virion morphogenesis protein [Paracoccus sp. (in: a-proteobacteria)]MDO5622309.1 phage virion morphogenesis protein [Paracoccus sp. (in: a-proteobacteria)]
MTTKVPGVSFTLTLNSEAVDAKLRAMLSRVSAPKDGFYDNVGHHMRQSTLDNFDKESAPDGTKWVALSKKRIRQRERQKLLPMTILNTNRGIGLKSSVAYQAGPDQVMWGATARHNGKSYARVHQMGAEINIPEYTRTIYRHFNPKSQKTNGRFVKKKNKHKRAEEVTYAARSITIPARPYLGIGPADEAEIYEIAKDWLSKHDTPKIGP